MNPVLFKQSGGKSVEEQPRIVEPSDLIKPVLEREGMEKVTALLLECYDKEDEGNMEELVKNLGKEACIWARQGYEVLHAFKEEDQFEKVVPYLMGIVADRHARFHLLSHFKG